MPWKEVKKETMREEFVKRVLSHEKSKSALCREYGISRPTGDKWICRYLAGEKLSDYSRAPKTTPRRIDAETEQMIVEYRRRYPAIGAAKMKRMMEDEGKTDLPCQRTFNDIFKRNGLITKEASLASTPHKRFEKEEPNEMWQGDFKGHFALENNVRCHPLCITDDCTRFNISCTPMWSETYREIRPIMERIFCEYGLPRTFLCDNGNPWGTSQSTGYTQFEVWLMDLGILTIHGRLLHPQTQGKEERFNGSLTREFLKYNSFADEADAQTKLAQYRDFYNNKRPHHALKLATPASKYTASPRRYPERIEEWEYPSEYKIHKVKSSGYVTIGGQGYFLSEAFGDRLIGVIHKENALIELVYRQFIIGRIDVDRRVFTSKKAYLIHNDPRSSLM